MSLLLIFSSSCKKEAEKPNSKEDFKVLMQIDKDIAAFANLNTLLLSEAKLSNQLDAITKSEAAIKPATEEEIKRFKNTAKNKNDIKIFISQHLKGNAVKILEYIQAETNSIILFTKNNPDFNKLKGNEREELIVYILNEKSKKSYTPLTISNIKLNSNKLMLSKSSLFMVADDCLYNLNMAIRDCDFNFNLGMSVAIAGSVIAIISSAGIGSVAAEIGMQIAITAIIATQYHCYDTAGYQMDHCAAY